MVEEAGQLEHHVGVHQLRSDLALEVAEDGVVRGPSTVVRAAHGLELPADLLVRGAHVPEGVPGVLIGAPAHGQHPVAEPGIGAGQQGLEAAHVVLGLRLLGQPREFLAGLLVEVHGPLEIADQAPLHGAGEQGLAPDQHGEVARLGAPLEEVRAVVRRDRLGPAELAVGAGDEALVQAHHHGVALGGRVQVQFREELLGLAQEDLLELALGGEVVTEFLVPEPLRQLEFLDPQFDLLVIAQRSRHDSPMSGRGHVPGPPPAWGHPISRRGNAPVIP